MLTTHFLCLSEPPTPSSIIQNPPLLSKTTHLLNPNTTNSHFLGSPPKPSAVSRKSIAAAAQEEIEVESRSEKRELDGADSEVAEGYTVSQFCDKMIDLFLYEKPRVKEWRSYLVFREEWNKYRERFYARCRARAEAEKDEAAKQKLISLGRKVKRVDEEMERHDDLFKEVQDCPTDIDEVVARRRKDFTGGFFSYLSLLSEAYDGLEDRDALARLGARCLSAISSYDNILGIVENLDGAQAKFDDILNSPSIDAACDKIKAMAKAKELDSSLILLINSAWASAKESQTMKNEESRALRKSRDMEILLDGSDSILYFSIDCLLPTSFPIKYITSTKWDLKEVKDIMYRLYKAMKSSLRSIAPKEIKLLKYLLNITDPEERFSALATAFSPGDDREAKDPKALYTTPKELLKWIKIMLDAYHLNKEDTDLREAKQLSEPVVMQRLFILKETIEEEYLEKSQFKTSNEEMQVDP